MTPVNILFPILDLYRMEIAKTTAHQRLIFKVQKAVGVLIRPRTTHFFQNV